MNDISHTEISGTIYYKLKAGPISLKFQDGEVRYLCVGNDEILRRMYFSVRDGGWDTVIPSISDLVVESNTQNFSVSYNALCKSDKLEFSYQVQISGDEHGKIVFRVTGKPQIPSIANRFGICVHIGDDAVCGLPFTTKTEENISKQKFFPQLIGEVILDDKFLELEYSTKSKIKACVKVHGALFGLEDQRHFGDSSFKLFSGMPYSYQDVNKLDEHVEEVILELSQPGLTILPLISQNTVVVGNEPLINTIPKVIYGDPSRSAGFFIDAWAKCDEWTKSEEISWEFNPSVNLFDNDTLNENLQVVVQQSNTIKASAPDARLKVSAISLNPPFPRAVADARYSTPYAAVWVVAAIKQLALAGVYEATFNIGPAYAQNVLNEFGKYAGAHLLPVKLASEESNSGEKKYDALAFVFNQKTWIYLLNLSSENIELNLIVGKNDEQLFILPAHGMICMCL